MRNRARRSAFTMIELLVVISIMALLAAITMMSVKALGIGSKKAATETIIAAVRKGITLAEADRGGSVSAVEHPFAGSRAPRFAFRTASNVAVPTGTEAAYGPAVTDPATVTNSGGWALLLPSDVFANPAIPHLFGFRREYIYVLGSQQKRVTQYMRLPKPTPIVPRPTSPPYEMVISPVTGVAPLNYTNYPIAQFRIPSPAQVDEQDVNGNFTYGQPGSNKIALDYMFGSSGISSELSALKALYEAYEPPAGTPTTSEPKFRYKLNKASVTGPSKTDPDLPLAFTNVNAGTSPDLEDRWKPGRIALSSVGSTDSTIATASTTQWAQYRLPGLAIYDAWGVEILCSTTNAGSVRLISAGADGVFRISPGVDRVLQTTNALATNFLGDDKDGVHDNIPRLVGE
jgi:prepilin-type N-terminal cleavage/methylation domain-containing protein